jgi:hypothetical protein
MNTSAIAISSAALAVLGLAACSPAYYPAVYPSGYYAEPWRLGGTANPATGIREQ